MKSINFRRQCTRAALLPFVLLLLAQPALAAMSHGRALGTSAALDQQNRLWIVRSEPVDNNAHIVIERSDDNGKSWQPAVRATSKPEPVSADGENRPKIAFGPRNEIYVSWTSPTSAKFTGDIRFTRSLDGGKSWSTPAVIHHDRQLITHRFESLLVDRTGRVWVTWIDKRDLGLAQAAKRDYAGAAVYYAYSDDRGATWKGDYKLADNSCECCRIAMTLDSKNRAVAMWRHVFAGSERDHAFAVLKPEGKGVAVERATTDRWKIDACPHHGPSLAITEDGTRHAVWFNQVNGAGRAFYGQLTGSDPVNVQPLPVGAMHADVAARGNIVAVVWKRFDGNATQVESWLSKDGGRQFVPGPKLQTEGESDQPRVLSTGSSMLMVWRKADGVVVANLGETSGADAIKPFTRDTLRTIEQQHAGAEFWVVMWDLECVYCMKSLTNIAAVQKQQPALKVVTISTDPVAAAPDIRERLADLGVRSEAYAFAAAPEEALRYAIDPAWMGEKPRAYRYTADGARTSISGVLTAKELTGP